MEELQNWPRLVQLAWLVCDESGAEVDRGNEIIYPVNFDIPDEAADIHGITTERAMKEGKYIEDVMPFFLSDIKRSNLLVAHNIAFDEKIMGAELLRLEMDPNLIQIPKLCTMKRATRFCNLPGQYGGLKWPKLSELHQILFNEDFDNAHDALADVIACARCYWRLKELHLV